MYKVISLCVIFEKKLDGGYSEVYRWKFREGKGVKTFYFILFYYMFVFWLWGFNGYKEWIIQLNWNNYKL